MRKKYLSRLSAIFLIFFMIASGVDSVIAGAVASKKSKKSSSHKSSVHKSSSHKSSSYKSSSYKRKEVSAPVTRGAGWNVDNLSVEFVIDNQSQYSVMYMPNDNDPFGEISLKRGQLRKVPKQTLQSGESGTLGFLENYGVHGADNLMHLLVFKLTDAVDYCNRKYSFGTSVSFNSGDGTYLGAKDSIRWTMLGSELAGLEFKEIARCEKRTNASSYEEYKAMKGDMPLLDLETDDKVRLPVKLEIESKEAEVTDTGRYHLKYTISILNADAESSGGIPQSKPLSVKEGGFALRKNMDKVNKELEQMLDERKKHHAEDLDRAAELRRQDFKNKVTQVLDEHNEKIVEEIQEEINTHTSVSKEWKENMQGVNDEMDRIHGEMENEKEVEETDGDEAAVESAEYKRVLRSLSSNNKKMIDKESSFTEAAEDFGVTMKAFKIKLNGIVKRSDVWVEKAEKEAERHRESDLKRQKKMQDRFSQAHMVEYLAEEHVAVSSNDSGNDSGSDSDSSSAYSTAEGSEMDETDGSDKKSEGCIRKVCNKVSSSVRRMASGLTAGFWGSHNDM